MCSQLSDFENENTSLSETAGSKGWGPSLSKAELFSSALESEKERHACPILEGLLCSG